MLEGVTQKTENFTYPYLTGTSVNLCRWVLFVVGVRHCASEFSIEWTLMAMPSIVEDKAPKRGEQAELILQQ